MNPFYRSINFDILLDPKNWLDAAVISLLLLQLVHNVSGHHRSQQVGSLAGYLSGDTGLLELDYWNGLELDYWEQ